ncbi:carboxypeptidase-like regulatory domain-containing protein [Chryseobacterium sp. SN22]|uniref:carboxypeptidase-like regulatory domain-containing protein n=1 Tax=Chryseobacterium sp. SN22 TaxID=2606431 RepID=UPI0016274707|nr:carboxypeptidase-like regulatory domain-containing protein [Chryseobacterium sp. SN22]
MKHLCLLFILLFLKVSAQTEIKGFIISENNQPVSRANVILIDSKDHIITFVFSNKDGSFLLNTDKFGEFILQISASGYTKKTFRFPSLKKIR